MRELKKSECGMGMGSKIGGLAFVLFWTFVAVSICVSLLYPY